MPPIKRKSLDVSAKYAIIKERISGEKISTLMTKYNLKSIGHVTNLMRKKEQIVEAFEKTQGKKKSLKGGKLPDLDDHLSAFIIDCNGKKLPVTEYLLKEEAADYCKKNKIDTFKGSHGYFQNFAKRQNVILQTIHGDANGVSQELTDNWKEKLPDLCDGYGRDDIFNVDELGLFYKLIPSRTLTVKGSVCKTGKKSKVRITVLLGSNASGTDKLKPFVIGRSVRPHAIRSDLKNHTLKVRYSSNRSAWMTGSEFEKYLSELNTDFEKKGRKVLLFLDNCPAHPNQSVYSNIKLVFLPVNTTSVLQPMDQGIIKVFKDYYRRKLIRHFLNGIRSGKQIESVPATIGHAISFILAAWNEVEAKTISNCFMKAGFSGVEDEVGQEILAIDGNDGEIDDLWNDLNSKLSDNEATVNDYLNCDNDLAVTGESAIDILNRSLNHFNSDTEDDEQDTVNEEIDNFVQPTFSEMVQFVELGRRYTYFFDSPNVTADFIDKMEKEISRFRGEMQTKQSKLTDYFGSDNN